MLKVSAFLVLLAATVFLPLPFVFGLFIVFISFLSGFWQGVLIGIFLDCLYFPPSVFLKIHCCFFVFCFLILFLLAEKLKDFFRSESWMSKLIVAFLTAIPSFFILFLFF